MIQIDIEMPKCCDVCMFSQWSNLSQTASCKLKDYEPCFADFSKEYKSKRANFCPLHEVTDTDTISRQQAIEVAMQYCPDDDGSCSKADRDIRELLDDLENLPPSPSIEPDSDTISRQKVISTINVLRPRCDTDDIDDYHDLLVEAIEVLPPSPSRPQWIPCSNRLPDEEVLCCDTRGEMIIGYPYQDEESNTGYSAVLDDIVMIDCTAWMSLPEPYHRP